jgi:type IV pilus assembly protein PilM
VAGRTAIGLDIGTSGVRAAELSFGKGGVTLERFGQIAVPEGAVRDGEVIDTTAVAHAIKQLWSHTRFSHKNVVMGVANQRVIVRQVDLPWMPIAELKESLAFQVQDFLPMPVDQTLLDFHPLEEVTGVGGARLQRGLLIAAARERVLSNVRAVQQAGLKPTMVDLTSFAVLRSVANIGVVDNEIEALIDIGSRVTNIIVHSGGVPHFVRILLMGGQDVTDAIASSLGVTNEQAEALKHELGSGSTSDSTTAAGRVADVTAASLVDEIRGSLDYYSSSTPHGPVQRVVLTGGGSRLRGLVDRMAASTRVPVVVGNPLGSLHLGRTGLSDDQVRHVQHLAAVPVGLALGAAS